MDNKFDAIVIGTGQSGPNLAKKCGEKGWRVAIIEEGHFGGSCINTGCTPTKTLVAHAKIAESIRRAGEFGIEVGAPHVDYAKVKKRVDGIVQSRSHWVKQSLQETPNCTLFEGHAAFVDPYHVQVNGILLEGKKFFLDVGAKPHVPPIPGLDKIPYLTNISLLALETLPQHLLILGGGYIALEFGQIYRRLGSQVTILQHGPRIMSKEDPDISEAIHKFLEKEGIKIVTNAKDLEILPSSREGQINARTTVGNITGSHLLIATGRIPNTDRLGAEKANISLDKKGFIIVDDSLRTSQPHIWALGDCNGRGAFTHTSYNDFEIIAANLFENGSRKVSDRIPIYALFTDPPLGRVGLNESQASHLDYHVAILPMSSIARAREKGETEGFLKILVDPRTDQILGASFLGTSCDEVVQLIAALMSAKVPYTLLQHTVFIHPTITEFLPILLTTLTEKKEPLPTVR